MKRADAKTSAANKQQPSELDEDFIGPPIPRATQKSVPVRPEQTDNNLKKVMIATRQLAF